MHKKVWTQNCATNCHMIIAYCKHNRFLTKLDFYEKKKKYFFSLVTCIKSVAIYFGGA